MSIKDQISANVLVASVLRVHANAHAETAMKGYSGAEYIRLTAEIYNELLGERLETLAALATKLRTEDEEESLASKVARLREAERRRCRGGESQ